MHLDSIIHRRSGLAGFGRTAAVIGFVMALAPGSGCRSEKQSSDEDSKADPLESGRARLGALSDRIQDGVGSGIDTTRDKAAEVADRLDSASREAAARAAERARTMREKAAEMARDPAVSQHMDSMVAAFGRQIDRLGDDPDAPRDAGDIAARFVLRSIPVVGRLDRYADARALYAAHADGDDEASVAMRAEARRQCLLACIQGGLDLTLLGLPSALEMPVVLADQLVDAAVLGQRTSKLIDQVPWVDVSWGEMRAENLDVLSPTLDRALAVEAVDRAMTRMLTYDFQAR